MKRSLCLLVAAALFVLCGCSQPSAEVRMREGQVPLTLLHGEFYMDEGWEVNLNVIEGSYAQATVANQLMFTNSIVELEDEAAFWQWVEAYEEPQLEQLADSYGEMLTDVDQKRTTIGGFPAHRVFYRAGGLGRVSCHIYLEPHFIHAQWSEFPADYGLEVVITETDFDALLATLHRPDDAA